MVIRDIKIPLTVPLAALLIAAICYDGSRLLGEQRFNDALAADDIHVIDGPGGVHLQFAKAYELQAQRDFKGALKAYAAIDARPRSRLHLDIHFNLANLYFREAIRLREAGAEDLAMPLLELAKQNYKDILRAESNSWHSKYNLELALVLSPELEAIDALEERNPEHSPRALTTIRSREPLP